MCGILGVIRGAGHAVAPSMIQRMCTSLTHRGPDDEGYLFFNPGSSNVEIFAGPDTPDSVLRHSNRYCPDNFLDARGPDPESSVALAHRRLSIIDISPSGHQPMCNADGSLWMVYNGEVYNYRELRRELERLGHTFVSEADSEVVLHAYEQWGADCLSRFNGMFAIAILDTKRGQLFCARDRFGIKPFYYVCNSEGFAFASEIKAILRSGMIRPAPNLPIVYNYLYSANDDIRETFYEGIVPLQPGHHLTIDLDGRNPVIQRYYELPWGPRRIKLSNDEFAEGFLERFSQSVRYRLIADVPVGTCLSGGLDSSAIVCMADKLMSDAGLKTAGQDLQSTFSARYSDSRHDEGEWIDRVLDATDCRPHTTFPSGEKLLNELDDLVWHHEEPFGSTSIFAQWSVFKLVKQSAEVGVKVTLDGQGGDELLGGYHRYFATYLANLAGKLKLGRLWQEAADCQRLHGYSRRNLAFQVASVFVPPSLKQTMRSFAGQDPHPEWMDRGFTSRFSSNPDVLRRNAEYYQWDTGNVFEADLYRSITYGIPRLLRHGDRNSMAHSIESRVPFLDHELVEYCFALPDDQKIRNGTTKVVLRDATRGLMPDPVRLRHSKLGFSTPQDTWFRNDLRGLVDEVVTSNSFAERGFFDMEKVRSLWAMHQAGQVNADADIWKWTNLELWMRRFID